MGCYRDDIITFCALILLQTEALLRFFAAAEPVSSGEKPLDRLLRHLAI